MVSRNKIKYFLVIILFTAIISSYFIINYGLPNNFSVVKDTESTVDLRFPLGVYIKGEEECNTITINGQDINNEYLKIESGSSLKVSGREVGNTTLNIKLFGIIPIRTVEVSVLPEVKVYPGGQAIGVMVSSQGVMVVDNSYVDTGRGKVYPARNAGIEVGDSILEINGKSVNDKNLLFNELQKYGKQNEKISLLIKKGGTGNIREVEIQPARNIHGDYMIGLYVDDGVSGVGTLTFYDENSGEYGALGHVVTESESRRKMDVSEGKIFEAKISGIHHGQQGIPGEKHGSFFQTKDILGEIRKNTQFGIYGSLNSLPSNPYFKDPIPVAAASQVEEGSAKIYTVIKGSDIEEYEIEIERVNRQSSPATKGLVINIKDPELKRNTGGIIQGMSGSPIVQDDLLVGAVTHVFINNPSRGYGVFAEWMINETQGILDNSTSYPVKRDKVVNF